LTRIDAAGQTTNYAYNSAGQLVRVINPKQDTTGFTYNSSGYLTKIQGPRAGDSTTFVYDTFGRVQKRRNPDGYALQYAYDAMDRVTRITYPDNTFEEMAYNKLDLEAQTDRLGRTTRTIHNAIRQPIIIQDPLLRVTNLEWCACGSLKSLTDPAGNKTQWKRDLGGRVTEKTFADGKKIQYQYEDSTSRLKSRTDAKGQVAHYSYGKDDNLLQVSYTNTGVTTPTVSYAYDSLYDRLHTMTDTTGVTTYTYHPITTTPALGAGRLSKIDGVPSRAVAA
jgi:YD repeat-containing protein